MSDVLLLNGRLIDPPPELSWRTRREIKLTRMLGLPTFANACFTSSAFMMGSFFWIVSVGILAGYQPYFIFHDTSTGCVSGRAVRLRVRPNQSAAAFA